MSITNPIMSSSMVSQQHIPDPNVFSETSSQIIEELRKKISVVDIENQLLKKQLKDNDILIDL